MEGWLVTTFFLSDDGYYYSGRVSMLFLLMPKIIADADVTFLTLKIDIFDPTP
jgi:hypothetical protein